MCIRRGGVITGEHGVGMEKREFMNDMFSDKDMDQMLILTDIIDPHQIANNDKVCSRRRVPGI